MFLSFRVQAELFSFCTTAHRVVLVMISSGVTNVSTTIRKSLSLFSRTHNLIVNLKQFLLQLLNLVVLLLSLPFQTICLISYCMLWINNLVALNMIQRVVTNVLSLRMQD